jgi:hypothetical protein
MLIKGKQKKLNLEKRGLAWIGVDRFWAFFDWVPKRLPEAVGAPINGGFFRWGEGGRATHRGDGPIRVISHKHLANLGP